MNSGERTAYALAHEEGEALWFFGMLNVIRASAAQTGGAMCFIEQLGRHGTSAPMHRQLDDDETWYILEGEVTFHIDGETMQAGPGATVHVPAATPHSFRIDSDQARFLNVTTARHEAFFRAAGEPAQERALPPDAPPDMGKLAAAAEAHGVEILGPPPF